MPYLQRWQWIVAAVILGAPGVTLATAGQPVVVPAPGTAYPQQSGPAMIQYPEGTSPVITHSVQPPAYPTPAVAVMPASTAQGMGCDPMPGGAMGINRVATPRPSAAALPNSFSLGPPANPAAVDPFVDTDGPIPGWEPQTLTRRTRNLSQKFVAPLGCENCDNTTHPNCDIAGICAGASAPGRDLWVRTDYLLWWTRDTSLPALATTSPGGTPVGVAGVLGEPGTSVLYGDERLDGDPNSGARFRIGGWLDLCHTYALEADYLFLADEDHQATFSSPGTSIIARPFLNMATGFQDAQLISYPGFASGDITFRTEQSFQSAGAWLRGNAFYSGWCDGVECTACGPQVSGEEMWHMAGYSRVDFVGGYRFYRLDDTLGIQESVLVTGPGGTLPIGSRFDMFDGFSSENEFHGVEIGLEWSAQRARFTLDAGARVALGTTRQQVMINGGTAVASPGFPPQAAATGLLTQETNIGEYERDRFSAIPQLQANLGYRLTPGLQLYAGYNFIYWQNVVIGAEQVDLGVNTTQIPPGVLSGTPRPDFEFRQTNFWAHGLTFGAEWRF